jgi:hypothetical protein
MTPQTKSNTLKIWDLALRTMIPVVMTVAAVVITHEVRISNIEANRFTDRDGYEMQERIMEKLPPKWLREDLISITQTQKEIKSELQRLSIKIEQVKAGQK